MNKLLIYLIILLSACASPQKRFTPSPPERLYSKQELLSILKLRNKAVNSIEGKVSSRIKNGGKNRKTTELILIKKPQHLRMDILSPFGSPVLTMATNGDNLNLQYHSKNRFFSGKVGDPNVAAILSPSLNIEEFILILTGGIPMIKFDTLKSSATWESEGYRLSLQNDAARQDIFFDDKGLYPVKSIIYGHQGTTLLSITMSKYEEVNKFNFPSVIEFFLPLEDYEMKVKYSRMTLNESLKLEAFNINPPEGVFVEGFKNLDF